VIIVDRTCRKSKIASDLRRTGRWQNDLTSSGASSMMRRYAITSLGELNVSTRLPVFCNPGMNPVFECIPTTWAVTSLVVALFPSTRGTSRTPESYFTHNPTEDVAWAFSPNLWWRHATRTGTPRRLRPVEEERGFMSFGPRAS